MSVDGMGSSDVYGRKRVGVGISDVSRRRRSMDVLSYRTVREGTGRFQGLETKGDVAALYGLGVMATNGLGMPRNDEKGAGMV